jgi:hypothetical protein
MAGRPSIRTPEIEEEILRRMSAGEPLAQICRDDGMPHPSTWREWCRADKSLDIAHAHARDDGEDQIVLEALSYLDQEPDRIIGGDGTSRYDPTSHAWNKERYYGRLKLLAKWNPKRWAERTTITGDEEAPVEVVNRSDADLARLLLFQLTKGSMEEESGGTAQSDQATSNSEQD